MARGAGAGWLAALLLCLPVAVRCDTPARRIVSLAPHLTELVYSLGAGDRLVGTVAHSDFPEAARELPRVGDAFRLDFERIAVLRPDLVLAWEGGNPAALVSRLQRLGFRVERFATREPEDVALNLKRLGALTGRGEVAAEVAGAYLEGLEALRVEHLHRPRLAVFYQVAHEPLYTVGGGHYISRLLELCGGRNVFAALTQLAPVVSLEAILDADPELIVAGARDLEELRRQWSAWPGLAAVRWGNLAVVDPDLTGRASTRLLAGAVALCAAVDAARNRRPHSSSGSSSR